ncbi:uncharacterized protein [Spinacia oleracea]|uniref:Uncharacterized protein n=1 Tax=Spinacia oleracea TaxID=3562 RepID=A0ABM3R472_SPIOL|nr:uncharacterized protein LOC130465601 [Spinacia oleracea]
MVLQMVKGLTKGEYDTIATMIQQSKPFPSFSRARSSLQLEYWRRASHDYHNDTALVVPHSIPSGGGSPPKTHQHHNPGGAVDNRGVSSDRGRGYGRGGKGKGREGLVWKLTTTTNKSPTTPLNMPNGSPNGNNKLSGLDQHTSGLNNSIGPLHLSPTPLHVLQSKTDPLVAFLGLVCEAQIRNKHTQCKPMNTGNLCLSLISDPFSTP